MRLTTTWAKYVLACVLALGLGSLAWTTQENQTKTKAGKSVTVTGCLQKGDGRSDYILTEVSTPRTKVGKARLRQTAPAFCRRRCPVVRIGGQAAS